MLTEEDLLRGADTLDTFDGVDGLLVGVIDLGTDKLDVADGRRVGVADLDTDLDGGAVILDVGVEDLAEGFENLPERAIDFEAGKVGLEVGVEGLEGLAVEGNVGRLVGVAGLDAVDSLPPDDAGLRVPAPEKCKPGDEGGCCLNAGFPLAPISTWEFASLDFNEV